MSLIKRLFLIQIIEKLKNILIICCLIIISSCTTNEGDFLIIDPEEFIDNEIALSELADDVSYIPLDNTYPLGIYSYRVIDSLIYLSAKDIGLLVYNREGKNVRRIGAKGDGPGEYQYCLSFAIDKLTGYFYVLDREKAKVYSPDGTFIRDIQYGNYIGSHHADDIEVFHSFLFFSDDLNNGDSKNNWVFLDTLGNPVSVKKNSIPPFKTSFGNGCSVYMFNDNLFYCNKFNDTVFSISSDLTYKAAYMFELGNHGQPMTMIEYNSLDELSAKMRDVCRIYNMFETRKFIVLEYYFPGKSAYCFIDKKTKRTFLAHKTIELHGKRGSGPYLINDLDGGMPLTGTLNYFTESGGEYLTTLLDPHDLKAYISGGEFKKAVPKNPEKKAALERLADSLSETDNPVLMMVRLK